MRNYKKRVRNTLVGLAEDCGNRYIRFAEYMNYVKRKQILSIKGYEIAGQTSTVVPDNLKS